MSGTSDPIAGLLTRTWCEYYVAFAGEEDRSLDTTAGHAAFARQRHQFRTSGNDTPPKPRECPPPGTASNGPRSGGGGGGSLTAVPRTEANRRFEAEYRAVESSMHSLELRLAAAGQADADAAKESGAMTDTYGTPDEAADTWALQRQAVHCNRRAVAACQASETDAVWHVSHLPKAGLGSVLYDLAMSQTGAGAEIAGRDNALATARPARYAQPSIQEPRCAQAPWLLFGVYFWGSFFFCPTDQHQYVLLFGARASTNDLASRVLIRSNVRFCARVFPPCQARAHGSASARPATP